MAFSPLATALQPDACYVLAFSGGLDSTVLLHQLVCWRQQQPQLRLRALHVHHGLSPNADRWAQHCRHLCQQWQVPCEILHVQVDGRDSGIEAAARAARYQALFAALQPDEQLLTAQHQDDQCETLLLALKRGSGPAGLAAMPARRQVGAHPHLRPLLAINRLQLEQYAAEHQLDWIEDESNADSRYDRNFLRQQVLPLLRARWPHFSAATARSAALCGEQEQLLNELLAEQLAQLTDAQGALHFPPLLAMSEIRRHALLRRWIASRGGAMPSRDALQRITDEVMCSREDAQPCLHFGSAVLRRYRQHLFWLPALPSLRQVTLAWPQLSQPLPLPSGLGELRAHPATSALRLPAADEQVTVRFHAHGYYHLVGRNGGRELKKVWQALGVPPWQRERIPLIFFNQTLIAAPGYFITREGAASDDAGWQAIWSLHSQDNSR
ncbi:tRNA lysidine(34) synthetase TilS [Candidatus Pantoea soli]|uniref:tRNA(Ile)-lysidine synthase n=1 Tax=Candidatus Pantoea soli TaxID=3098669 RepID=A0A518XA38_9GAMM|nr:tRNA lysidine(34) synthetase TilS [Pantoea soli]QDY41064.1 tRNA lysidine(34) synthetase TilS [Pantoea soli]